MSGLDIAVEKILDEDDDVESEKEQDAMDGAESSAKNPTNKIPEPSLGEAIALLREAIKLHTAQNTEMGSKSKVNSTLSLTADSTLYSTNSVNLVADPASFSANSGKLMADPAKNCCSSNKVSNTLTADSAIPCDTNSGTQCAMGNSDEDYLNDISLEKIENLLKSVLPPENIEGLEPNKVNIENWRTISHQTKSADLKLQNMQALLQKSFAVIANMADDLYKNRTEKDEKVISQTIKDSICKCADAAVFLGKINQDILNLRREKIDHELNQNYKQLTFKTEDHPKQLFGDDLCKTINKISETNKVDQSLTQRYQPTLKREMFTKTGKPFLFKNRGYQ